MKSRSPRPLWPWPPAHVHHHGPLKVSHRPGYSGSATNTPMGAEGQFSVGGLGQITATAKPDVCPLSSCQEVVRFQQPDQFRRPFPSLRHLSGISEGEGLC
jgi:hypothetical protein